MYQPRGYVLLATMISVVILTLLIVSAIQFTGVNRRAATAQASYERTSACAETARRYLLAKIKQFDLPMTQMGSRLNDTLPDHSDPARQSKIMAAHYGQSAPPTNPTISVVSASAISAARAQARDMSNVSPQSSTLGGQYYRVVVKCEEPIAGGTPREQEVEFVFRYGL